DPAYIMTGGNYPWTGSAWYFQGGGENGDLCVGTSIYDSTYKFQRVWSNTAAAAGGDPCVPAIGDAYYSVSAPKDWYSLTGCSVRIPLTGFSTKRVGDWIVDASQFRGSTTFNVSLSSPTTTTIQGQKVNTINNGRTATLNVSGGSSGDYAYIWIVSESMTGG